MCVYVSELKSDEGFALHVLISRGHDVLFSFFFSKRVYRSLCQRCFALSMSDSTADVEVKAFGDFAYQDVFERVAYWAPINRSTFDALSHACHATRQHITQDSDYARTSFECACGCHLRFSKHLQVSEISLVTFRLLYSAQLSTLEFLSINHSPASGKHIAEAVSECPSLRVLHLVSTDIDNSVISAITHLHHLEELKLSECNSDGTRDYPHPLFMRPWGGTHFGLLGGCKSLRRLSLIDMHLRDTEVAEIAKLPNLEELCLRGCPFARTMAPLAACMLLRVLDIGNTLICDDELAAFAQLPHLEKFVVAGTFVTKRNMKRNGGEPVIWSFAPLGACKSLKSLELCTNGIDDSGVAAIAQLPHLEDLCFGVASFRDFLLSASSFVPIGACKTLRKLTFFKTNIDNGGVAAIAQLPLLEDLSISCRAVTSFAPLGACKSLKKLLLEEATIDSGGVAAISQLPLLEDLSLKHGGPGASFAPLGGCKSLKNLNVSHTFIQDPVVAAVAQAPLLEQLCMSRCMYVKSFAPLGACKLLKVLNVNDTSMDEGFAAIGQLLLLESLSMESCDKVASFAPLATCRSLTFLNITATIIDDEGVAVIAQLPRLKEVHMACCKYVTSFAPLGACKTLKKLKVSVLNEISDETACHFLEELCMTLAKMEHL